MNRQQQQARDRAVKVFQHYVEVLFEKAGASASYNGDTAAEIEGIVDDIITAATPGRSEHAEAVDDLRRRSRDPEGPVERATNDGSIGTGRDRNRDELQAIADNPDPRD